MEKAELKKRLENEIGCPVANAEQLAILGDEPDQQIVLFRYKCDGAAYWLRGAFTNGDPVWEEDDPIAFVEMLENLGYYKDEE